MAKNVKSTVKLNMPMVRKLTAAAATSLEMTAEAIHTDVVQSQVIPRDTGKLQGESTHISAGKSETATYENGQTVTNGISKAVMVKLSYQHQHRRQEDYIIIRNTTSIRRSGQMKAARNMKEMQMLKADGLMTI